MLADIQSRVWDSILLFCTCTLTATNVARVELSGFGYPDPESPIPLN